MTETVNQPSTPVKSDSNLMAALGYLGFISIVMLLVKKDDPYVKFHAKQGLVLFIGMVLGVIPFVGWILWLAAVVLSIVGFINAISGKQAKLPVIGDLAEKINF
jgi:fumarate reductase subunit D